MLTQTAEYALRAVVYLAQQAPGELVRAGPLAAALDIPQNYLQKILHQLARSGVLRSTRGKSGGFTLGRAADQTTLHDIIAPFDSIDERAHCLLGRPECSSKNPCPAHGRWQGVAQQINEFFGATSLADVAKGPPSAAWARAFVKVPRKVSAPVGAKRAAAKPRKRAGARPAGA